MNDSSNESADREQADRKNTARAEPQTSKGPPHAAGNTDGPDIPKSGVLLGLDYGTKRVGVAVSDREQSIASPLVNYTRRGNADADLLSKVADEYRAVALIVGLPVYASGDEGQKAREARAFGKWAAEVTGLPVRYWDERYTSKIAEMHLQQAELTSKQRRRRRDKLAAQIMLQSYLGRAET